MFELKKWEPLRDLSTIQREMDELFRRTFGSLTTGLFRKGVSGAWIPDVDCFTRNEKYVIHCDVPGVDPSDVNVTVTGNILTIKGERRSDVKKEKEGYIFHETCSGSFERMMTLPEGVETDKIHATMKNGVLELELPAKAEVLPKKVRVEIEGKSEKKAA